MNNLCFLTQYKYHNLPILKTDLLLYVKLYMRVLWMDCIADYPGTKLLAVLHKQTLRYFSHSIIHSRLFDNKMHSSQSS